MAEKASKEKDAEKKSDKENEGKEAKGDSPEKVAKKRKGVLLLGVGGVLLTCALGGGFFAYKTFLAKPATAHATEEEKKTDAHGDKKDDPHGEKKADAHGEKKDDAHGEKKADAHGEKKDDAHGEKKDDAHGEKKADAHGEKKDDAHGDKKETKEEESAAKKKKSYGDTFSLPKMELNLGNPIENRYLRLALTLEYKGDKGQQEELKQREAQLKDIVINAANSKTRLDLLSSGGKDKLRRELLNKFNEVLEQPISAVYFTEFLVE